MISTLDGCRVQGRVVGHGSREARVPKAASRPAERGNPLAVPPPKFINITISIILKIPRY